MTRVTGRRIGVFGGTFDPPHIGHLVAALEVRSALDLDEVRLVVAGEPWQKVGTRTISSAADRLALVRAAVGDRAELVVDDVEIRRGGSSYTVDTLEALAGEHPDDERFLIVGDDAAAGFVTWERYEDVAALAHLVVVDRPGTPTPVDERFEWTRVDIPELEISSTDLRRRVAEGRSIDYLTPAAVVAAIAERGLYRHDS